jgi:hypothetical protein
MVLRDLSLRQTRDILNALSNQGYGFIADNNREEAKAAIKGEGSPLASIAPGEYLPPRKNVGFRMTARGVSNAVKKIAEQAKNAVPARAVQSFSELPEHIRKAYAGQENALEGVYDPQTRTVWLVADNLTDAGRVADVWAHEAVVHGGLRSLFSPAQLRTILDKMWVASGTRTNEKIREIAERYGLDLSNPTDRRRAVEEYIANLAEGKRQELLNQKEQTFWRRLVHIIRNAWNDLVNAIAGRDTMVEFKNVDALLAELGRHVMEGRSAAVFSDQESTAASVRSEQPHYTPAPSGKRSEAYVTLPNGSIDFAQFPEVTLNDGRKMKAAPVRLQRGNDNMGLNGSGYEHIEKAHGDEIRKAGYASAQEFVWDLVNSFDAIWQGEGASVLIVKNDGTNHKPVGFIELTRDGEFYRVKNAYPAGSRYPTQATRKLLWKRPTSASSASDKQNPFSRIAAAPESHAGPEGTLQRQREQSSYDVETIPQSEDENKPLASLRTIRTILGMKPSEAAEMADFPEIKALLNDQDLGLIQRITSLPHWIAKDFPGFKKIYDRQLKRMDDREAMRKKSLEEVSTLFGSDKDKGVGPHQRGNATVTGFDMEV